MEKTEVVGDDGKTRALFTGTSDHAYFLKAGLPGIFWKQRGDESVKYLAHTDGDTYEMVVPRYLEHSATVIALGALGTANLDHMLSREKLLKPTDDLAAPAGVPAACTPVECGEI